MAPDHTADSRLVSVPETRSREALLALLSVPSLVVAPGLGHLVGHVFMLLAKDRHALLLALCLVQDQKIG